MQQAYAFANHGTSDVGARFKDHVDTQDDTLGYRLNRADVQWLDLSVKGYATSPRAIR